MNAEKKISVIVPIYNQKKYLAKCLDSILEQTYKNLEIILVDDGSTDGSSLICDNYSKTDSRIKVFHQKNKGVSAARNLGIKNVTGEYLVFIDPDDYIDRDYISYLLNLILTNKNCELVVCGYLDVDEYGKEINKSHNSFQYNIFNSQEYMKYLFCGKSLGYQGYLWNKIFNVELIKRHELEFKENIFYNEDRLFVCKYLLYCNYIYFSNKPFYFYRHHSSSAMELTKQKISNKMLTEIVAFEEMKKLIKGMDDIYIYLVLDEYNSCILLRSKINSKDEKKVKIMDNLIKDDFLYIMRSNYVSIKRKVKILIKYLILRLSTFYN